MSNIDIKEVSPNQSGGKTAFFVVINERGPGWDPKHVMREQKGWTDHAKFMDALKTEHFVILGGPLKYSKHRAILVVNSSDEQELRRDSQKIPGCAPVFFELLRSIPGRFSSGNSRKSLQQFSRKRIIMET